MSIRCRFGWHDPHPVPKVTFGPPWSVSLANAQCRHCQKWMWVNWPAR